MQDIKQLRVSAKTNGGSMQQKVQLSTAFTGDTTSPKQGKQHVRVPIVIKGQRVQDENDGNMVPTALNKESVSGYIQATQIFTTDMRRKQSRHLSKGNIAIHQDLNAKNQQLSSSQRPMTHQASSQVVGNKRMSLKKVMSGGFKGARIKSGAGTTRWVHNQVHGSSGFNISGSAVHINQVAFNKTQNKVEKVDSQTFTQQSVLNPTSEEGHIVTEHHDTTNMNVSPKHKFQMNLQQLNNNFKRESTDTQVKSGIMNTHDEKTPRTYQMQQSSRQFNFHNNYDKSEALIKLQKIKEDKLNSGYARNFQLIESSNPSMVSHLKGSEQLQTSARMNPVQKFQMNMEQLQSNQTIDEKIPQTGTTKRRGRSSRYNLIESQPGPQMAEMSLGKRKCSDAGDTSGNQSQQSPTHNYLSFRKQGEDQEKYLQQQQNLQKIKTDDKSNLNIITSQDQTENVNLSSPRQSKPSFCESYPMSQKSKQQFESTDLLVFHSSVNAHRRNEDQTNALNQVVFQSDYALKNHDVDTEHLNHQFSYTGKSIGKGPEEMNITGQVVVKQQNVKGNGAVLGALDNNTLYMKQEKGGGGGTTNSKTFGSIDQIRNSRSTIIQQQSKIRIIEDNTNNHRNIKSNLEKDKDANNDEVVLGDVSQRSGRRNDRVREGNSQDRVRDSKIIKEDLLQSISGRDNGRQNSITQRRKENKDFPQEIKNSLDKKKRQGPLKIETTITTNQQIQSTIEQGLDHMPSRIHNHHKKMSTGSSPHITDEMLAQQFKEMHEHYFLSIKPLQNKLAQVGVRDTSAEGAKQKYLQKGIKLLNDLERAKVSRKLKYDQYYYAMQKKVDSYHLDVRRLNEKSNSRLSKNMSFLDLKRQAIKEQKEEEQLLQKVLPSQPDELKKEFGEIKAFAKLRGSLSQSILDHSTGEVVENVQKHKRFYSGIKRKIDLTNVIVEYKQLEPREITLNVQQDKQDVSETHTETKKSARQLSHRKHRSGVRSSEVITDNAVRTSSHRNDPHCMKMGLVEQNAYYAKTQNVMSEYDRILENQAKNDIKHQKELLQRKKSVNRMCEQEKTHERTASPMTVKLHHILQNVYGNLQFSQHTHGSLETMENDQIFQALPKSRQEYNFFKQRIQKMQMLQMNSYKSQKIMLDRLKKENQILIRNDIKFDLGIPENFRTMVRKFQGFDPDVKGIESPQKMIKRLKSLKYPKNMKEYKLRGTLSLSPRDYTSKKEDEIMMIYQVSDIAQIQEMYPNSHQLRLRPNQTIRLFKNQEILEQVKDKAADGSKESSPSGSIFNLHNQHIESNKKPKKSRQSITGLPQQTTKQTKTLSDDEDILQITKLNLNQKPTAKLKDQLMSQQRLQPIKDEQIYQMMNQQVQDTYDTQTTLMDNINLFKSNSSFKFMKGSPQVTQKINIEQIIPTMQDPFESQVTTPKHFEDMSGDHQIHYQQLYSQIHEKDHQQSRDMNQIFIQNGGGSKLNDNMASKLNPIYILKNDQNYGSQRSHNLIGKQSHPDQQQLGTYMGTNRTSPHQTSSYQIISQRDKEIPPSPDAKTQLKVNLRNEQLNRHNSGEQTYSSQSLHRQLRSDQDGPLTASFKYEDNNENNTTDKVTFLTQVDNREQRKIHPPRKRGLGKTQSRANQYSRERERSSKRRRQPSRERSTAFGQTERGESKVDRNPLNDATHTPQYLKTRSRLSSEKKSQTNNASKASLPKRGQIKNITIDRIVKDTQQNQEITEEDKSNRTREAMNTTIRGANVMSPDTFGAKAEIMRTQDDSSNNKRNYRSSKKKTPGLIFKQKKDSSKNLKGVPSCLQINQGDQPVVQVDQRQLRRELKSNQEKNQLLLKNLNQPVTIAELNEKPKFELQPLTCKYRNNINLLAPENFDESFESNESTVIEKDYKTQNVSQVAKKKGISGLQSQSQQMKYMSELQRRSTDPGLHLLDRLKSEIDQNILFGQKQSMEENLFKDMEKFDIHRNQMRFMNRRTILQNEEASRRLETSVASDGIKNLLISYQENENRLMQKDNELFSEYKRKSLGIKRRNIQRYTQQPEEQAFQRSHQDLQMQGQKLDHKTFFQVTSSKSINAGNANKKMVISQRQTRLSDRAQKMRQMSTKAISARQFTDRNVENIVDPEEQQRRYRQIQEMHRQVRLLNAAEQGVVTNVNIPKLNFEAAKDHIQAMNRAQTIELQKNSNSQRTAPLLSENGDERHHQIRKLNFNNDLNLTNDLNQSHRTYNRLDIPHQQLLNSDRQQQTIISDPIMATQTEKMYALSHTVQSNQVQSKISSPRQMVRDPLTGQILKVGQHLEMMESPIQHNEGVNPMNNTHPIKYENATDDNSDPKRNTLNTLENKEGSVTLKETVNLIQNPDIFVGTSHPDGPKDPSAGAILSHQHPKELQQIQGLQTNPQVAMPNTTSPSNETNNTSSTRNQIYKRMFVGRQSQNQVHIIGHGGGANVLVLDHPYGGNKSSYVESIHSPASPMDLPSPTTHALFNRRLNNRFSVKDLEAFNIKHDDQIQK